jgi:hypothetical protein
MLRPAIERINLVGAQLVQGNRQPIPGSGAELNHAARSAIAQLRRAVRSSKRSGCGELPALTAQRLRVAEF